MSDPHHPPANPPPSGREWIWCGAFGWLHKPIAASPGQTVAGSDYEAAKPTVSPPVRPEANPFEPSVRRNKPLPADHAGAVAVGAAIARLRRPA